MNDLLDGDDLGSPLDEEADEAAALLMAAEQVDLAEVAAPTGGDVAPNATAGDHDATTASAGTASGSAPDAASREASTAHSASQSPAVALANSQLLVAKEGEISNLRLGMESRDRTIAALQAELSETKRASEAEVARAKAADAKELATLRHLLTFKEHEVKEAETAKKDALRRLGQVSQQSASNMTPGTPAAAARAGAAKTASSGKGSAPDWSAFSPTSPRESQGKSPGAKAVKRTAAVREDVDAAAAAGSSGSRGVATQAAKRSRVGAAKDDLHPPAVATKVSVPSACPPAPAFAGTMGLSGPGILRRVLLPSGEAGDSGAQQGSKALNAGLCAFVAQPSDDGLLLLQAVGCFLANHSTQDATSAESLPYWNALLILSHSSPRAARAITGRPPLAPDLASAQTLAGPGPSAPSERSPPSDAPGHPLFGLSPRIRPSARATVSLGRMNRQLDGAWCRSREGETVFSGMLGVLAAPETTPATTVLPVILEAVLSLAVSTPPEALDRFLPILVDEAIVQMLAGCLDAAVEGATARPGTLRRQLAVCVVRLLTSLCRSATCADALKAHRDACLLHAAAGLLALPLPRTAARSAACADVTPLGGASWRLQAHEHVVRLLAVVGASSSCPGDALVRLDCCTALTTRLFTCVDTCLSALATLDEAQHHRCFRVIHECVTLLLAMPWEDRKLVDVQQPDMLSRLSVSATVSRLLRHFKELNVAETHQALAEDVQALYHDVMDSARSGE